MFSEIRVCGRAPRGGYCSEREKEREKKAKNNKKKNRRWKAQRRVIPNLGQRRAAEKTRERDAGNAREKRTKLQKEQKRCRTVEVRQDETI